MQTTQIVASSKRQCADLRYKWKFQIIQCDVRLMLVNPNVRRKRGGERIRSHSRSHGLEDRFDL